MENEAKARWKQQRHDERWEDYEERILRAFSAPTAVLPRQMAGHATGASGDFKMPRRFGEGDPSQFGPGERMVIDRLRGKTLETAAPGEWSALKHLRDIGHPDFQ